MAKSLKDLGYNVGRYRAQSLMKKADLEVKRPRKFKRTTNSRHKLPVAPNLVKQAEVYHYDPALSPPWAPGPLTAGASSVKSLGTSLATRDLPNGYIPLVRQSITLTVTPDPMVAVYAVEEVPPADWVVSVINESGSWDNGNQKVKWGPLIDNTPRVLSYKATQPSGDSGTKTFSGTASFDGTNVTIAGETYIQTNGAPFNIFLP
jgi:hypothetical protein